MTHNLCCHFPHGDAVVLPLIFTTMAVMSTLMGFGLLPWMGMENPDYGCIEYNVGTTRDHTCFKLQLNDESFWTGEDWAGGIQAGAVFGIFSSVMGAVAWALLLSATCLELKSRRIMLTRMILMVASGFALLTLVSASADVCKLEGLDNCDFERFYLDYGGHAMMAGFIFYFLAVCTMWGFGSQAAAPRPAAPPVIEKQESAPMEMEGTA